MNFLDIPFTLTRDASPMSQFMYSIGLIVNRILLIVTSYVAPIFSEPILLYIVGFIAVMGTIGIIGRLLRRS